MLHNSLVDLGFHISTSDHSLFVLKTSPDIVIILVYIDDILIIVSSTPVIQVVISVLSHKFALKPLGPLHFFLGLEVKRNTQGLFLPQTKYTLQLIQKANLETVKPCSKPISSG